MERKSHSVKTIAFLLWLLSVITYSLGILLPIMGTKTSVSILVLDYQALRVFDTIQLFWESRDYFLATLILMFTIVFPLFKYVDLLGRVFQGSLGWMRYVPHLPDKWSMLDVFLVAVLLINFKMSTSFISVHLMPGVYWLGASILVRMALSHLLDTVPVGKPASRAI